MENKNVGIYKITNLVNGKFYIGSSSNLKKRFYEHRRELNLGIHTNKHLQSAWNKYGEENFKFEVIETIDGELTLDNQYLRNIETDYIQKLKCYDSSIGYNFIPGGIGTLNLPCSEEKKKKISEANKGRKAWNKDIPMSEEQKELLKKVNRKKRGKAIDVFTTTGKFIETLDSVKAVVEKYGVAKNTITDSCRNRRTPKKYIFKYHNQEENTDVIESNKNYIKNKTYGENKFSIYDLNGKLLFECKYKKDVIFYLTGSTKRNGNIERKLKLCTENGESVCLYNKYIVKFVNALNNGDIIEVPRQLNRDVVKGIRNDANGEA